MLDEPSMVARTGCPATTHLNCRGDTRTEKGLFAADSCHAPGRIRTCDPRLRRPSLYPAELRGLALVTVGPHQLARSGPGHPPKRPATRPRASVTNPSPPATYIAPRCPPDAEQWRSAAPEGPRKAPPRPALTVRGRHRGGDRGPDRNHRPRRRSRHSDAAGSEPGTQCLVPGTSKPLDALWRPHMLAGDRATRTHGPATSRSRCGRVTAASTATGPTTSSGRRAWSRRC